MVKFVEIYIKQNIILHGIPSNIVLNRYSWFTYKFWESLQAALGMKRLSYAYHPKTDGQSGGQFSL